MTGSSQTSTRARVGLRFQLVLRQIAATAAVLLLVASPLAEALHAVLVPHAICAEHGEVVHAHGASSASAQPDGAVPSIDADATAQESSHGHCTIIAERSRQIAPPNASEAWLLPALRAQAEPFVTRAARASTSLELTLLAPKTSPPLQA